MGFVNYARAGSFPHSLATKQLHLLATREEVGETHLFLCSDSILHRHCLLCTEPIGGVRPVGPGGVNSKRQPGATGENSERYRSLVRAGPRL